MFKWRLMSSTREVLELSRGHWAASWLSVRQITDATRFQRVKVIATSGTKKMIPSTSVAVEASICELYDLSACVKGLKLKVDASDFAFKAGQWVDFYVPGIQDIGGYSICSTPRLLRDKGILELAVKSSPFPPTHWICTQSEVGSRVKVCVGGDFFFDPQPPAPPRDLLLVAGGVGINPLLSILRHAADLPPALCRPRRVLLAFSAPTLDDLIFRREITRLVDANSNMAARFFVTQHRQPSELSHLDQQQRLDFETNVRIGRSQLSSLLKAHFNDDTSNLDCYICGPTGLIDDTNESLLVLGLTPEQIKYEKWW